MHSTQLNTKRMAALLGNIPQEFLTKPFFQNGGFFPPGFSHIALRRAQRLKLSVLYYRLLPGHTLSCKRKNDQKHRYEECDGNLRVVRKLGDKSV